MIDAYIDLNDANSAQAGSASRHLYPGLMSRWRASSNSWRSTIGTPAFLNRKYHARSSTRWLPTLNIRRACPSVASSLTRVLRTRVAASMTAPNEFNHASLSWLDRKYTRIG